MQTDSSGWRIVLARKIAPVYAAADGCRAVLLLGGVVRGRGDAYSDIDMAILWDELPSEATRQALADQVESALGVPLAARHFYYGHMPEDELYVGGDAATGFKIDVNHRTVARQDELIDDVTLRGDTDGHGLETCYSMGHVLALHGADLAADWAARAAVYPDALALKLVRMHLSELRGDLAMHIHRGDLHLAYTLIVRAQFHLMGALLALNHVYRPELKRLDDLSLELTHRPENLAVRINHMLRCEPEAAARALDSLAEDVFALVETHMPEADVPSLRATYYRRRQRWDAPPEGLNLNDYPTDTGAAADRPR